jgi:hypothetical protein
MAFMIMPVYNIDSAVGEGKINQADDVRLVQTMLIELATADPGWAPPTPLFADGVWSPNLKLWILAFQTRLAQMNPGKAVVDGRIDPMPMKGTSDWSASFGSGAWSSMYSLNWALHHYARAVHIGLGDRLGLREGAK